MWLAATCLDVFIRQVAVPGHPEDNRCTNPLYLDASVILAPENGFVYGSVPSLLRLVCIENKQPQRSPRK